MIRKWTRKNGLIVFYAIIFNGLMVFAVESVFHMIYK